jgi:predicted ATPase
MIEKLTVQNFGCVENVENITLSPLHAFIGPNDSGKSTLLRAIATLAIPGQGAASVHRAQDMWSALADHARQRDVTIAAHTPAGFYYLRTLRQGEVYVQTRQGTEQPPWRYQLQVDPFAPGPTLGVVRQLSPARLMRLDPDSLRLDGQLIPDGAPLVLDEKGTRIAGLYDAIQNSNPAAFSRITDDVRRLFPTVKGLRLRNSSSSTKALEVVLTSGVRVGAQLMSEGLLYYLAFAAIPYVDRAAIWLIEEPENGLHPTRIKEVMAIFREISRSTQVLMSTHSPLVVNELEPQEVSVVTRAAGGTRVRAISESPNFEERKKVYALGELWVSYADGEEERPLFSTTKAL